MKNQLLILIFLSFIFPIVILSQTTELVLTDQFPTELDEEQGRYLNHPYGLKIYNDYFIVTDNLENEIAIFSKDKKLIRKFGRSGEGPGDLIAPQPLSIDPEDSILYCFEGGNGRISSFSLDGKFIKFFNVFMPTYSLLVFKGRIYTSSINYSKRTCQAIFSKKGELLKLFGIEYPNTNKLKYQDKLHQTHLVMLNENIYAIYEHLPFVCIYNLEGNLVKQIKIKNDWANEILTYNLNPKKVQKKRAMLFLKQWCSSVDVFKNKIYCYYDTKLGDFENNEGKYVDVYDENMNLLKQLKLCQFQKERIYLNSLAINKNKLYFVYRPKIVEFSLVE